MKKQIIIPFLVIILCSIFPAYVTAVNNTLYTVCMQKQLKDKKDPGNEGHRIPPVPVSCAISKNDGVKISSLSEEIISYEIWDASSKICIASLTEESEFIDYLFFHTGDFHIILETDNFYITGNISID